MGGRLTLVLCRVNKKLALPREDFHSEHGVLEKSNEIACLLARMCCEMHILLESVTK